MRPVILAAAFLAFTAPAFAQNASETTAPAPIAPAPAATATAPAETTSTTTTTTVKKHSHMTLAQRFAAANTTNDGHLTKEQAEAGGMKAVVKNFSAIDTDNKGYVTLDEIHNYMKAKRAAHKAKKTQG